MRYKSNIETSFFGLCLAGAFDISGDMARQWLLQPNPHDCPNSDVLRPLRNGNDILKSNKDRWVIDFGNNMAEEAAARYEMPFDYVVKQIKPVRLINRERVRAEKWWRMGRPRPELRKAIQGLSRYIATVETAKYRIFVWLPISVAPEHRLIVIAKQDDMIFGILSSSFHILWALSQGSTLGDSLVYNSTCCFQQFPFPAGLTPADTSRAIATLDSGSIIPIVATEYQDHAKAIAEAAYQLNQLREEWLNPPDWIERQPEVVAGYPDRIIPKPEYAAELKQRTLTNLYNEHPAWLANAHRQLDCAVAAAYGWEDDATELKEVEILQRLLALNVARKNYR